MNRSPGVTHSAPTRRRSTRVLAANLAEDILSSQAKHLQSAHRDKSMQTRPINGRPFRRDRGRRRRQRVGRGGQCCAAAAAACSCSKSSRIWAERRESLSGRSRLPARGGSKPEDIADSPDDHAEDAGKFASPEIEARNNSELRSVFPGPRGRNARLAGIARRRFIGPSPEPPNRVPRMHNAVPNAKAYIAALQSELARRGGTISPSAAVTDLLHENGRVVGVRVAKSAAANQHCESSAPSAA